MAETNVYLSETYKALQRLSADDKKHLEYEVREKALKDYNTQMSCTQKCGERRSEKCGIKKDIELACKVLRLQSQGLSEEEIAPQCCYHRRSAGDSGFIVALTNKLKIQYEILPRRIPYCTVL